MAQVYRIYNKITNQSYIGITNRTFRERYNCRTDWWNKTHNLYLKNSVLHYGSVNFDVEILEEGDTLNLSELEKSYIKKYNSLYPNGFNFRDGGHDNFTMTEASKLKLKKTLAEYYKNNNSGFKNKKLSKESLEKIRETKLKNGSNKAWNKGLKLGRPSEQAVINSADAHKKMVASYDKNFNLVKIYEAVKDCKFDGFIPSQVSKSCKTGKCYKGLYFRHLTTT